LRVVEIEIPTLRARGADDIVDLANHFVTQLSRRYRKGPLRLASATKPALAAYAWPGNVRELENTIERAVVLCQGPKITVKDLALAERPSPTASTLPAVPYNPNDSMIGIPVAPLPVQPNSAYPNSAYNDDISLPADLELEEVERRYAKAVLDRNDGNQSAAARALGISRNKLARLLR
jgi:DNA-binding NtrC family response regulator